MSKVRLRPVEIFTLLGMAALIVVVWSTVAGAVDGARRLGIYQASCLVNEKQLGLALLQYVEDNDGNMPDIAIGPADKTWRTALYPYVKADVYACPSRTGKGLGTDGFAQSYAANYSGDYNRSKQDKGEGAFAGPGSLPISAYDLKTPHQLIAFCEMTGKNCPELNIDNPAFLGSLWAGHRGGGNYTLADGHAKWLRPQDTYRVDASGKVIENDWYRDSKKPLSANGQALLRRAQTEF